MSLEGKISIFEVHGKIVIGSQAKFSGVQFKMISSCFEI